MEVIQPKLHVKVIIHAVDHAVPGMEIVLALQAVLALVKQLVHQQLAVVGIQQGHVVELQLLVLVLVHNQHVLRNQAARGIRLTALEPQSHVQPLQNPQFRHALRNQAARGILLTVEEPLIHAVL